MYNGISFVVVIFVAIFQIYHYICSVDTSHQSYAVILEYTLTVKTVIMNMLLLTQPLQSEAISTGTFIREILGSPMGSFASVFSIMILAGWLIYYVTKHVTRFKCVNDEHTNSVGKMDTKFDKVEGTLGGINRDISYIRGSIDILMRGVANPTVQSHSPVSLTDFGKSLAAEMDLDNMIARNWDKIYTYLDDNLKSQNAYDIQQFCIDTANVFLDKFFCEDDLNRVKTFAFQKGQPIMYYGSMVGVLVRDAYFKHKSIPIEDIDKHDPAKQ